MAKSNPVIDGAAAIPLAMTRAQLGMKNTTVNVGGGAEIYYKEGLGQLVIRRKGRSGGLNARATALKQCKGMTGDTAETCIKNAIGVVPKTMTKAVREATAAKKKIEAAGVKERGLGVQQ